MEQIGVVTKKKDSVVKVQFKRATACGENCGMCGGCENSNAFVDAKNEINADVGDVVKIQTDTKYVLLGAFFAYIVPILTGIFGYAVFGVIGAVTGVLLPFLLLKAVNPKLEKYFRPKVVKIIKKCR